MNGFLSSIKGKEFVLYAGLLDLAHQKKKKGIRSLKVDALQYPTKENGYVAICRAELESRSGEIFSEIGDANPTNVKKSGRPSHSEDWQPPGQRHGYSGTTPT